MSVTFWSLRGVVGVGTAVHDVDVDLGPVETIPRPRDHCGYGV